MVTSGMPDTQWNVFEVFHQQARGEPHVHVGSIHARDGGMALASIVKNILVCLEPDYGRIR